MQAFTFLPPTISVNPLTINTLSTYTFLVNRNYDITLQTTPWNTQLVPAGSKIDIIFPSQYLINVSSLPSINTLLINDITIINNISLTLSGTQTLVINNAIPTASAIANATIILNNVLNPSPAITTGSFVIQIGSDISSNLTGVATVTLQSGTFNYCGISFNPSYVNSSSAMLLNITPNNKIPITGQITITFPSSLQWSQDVSTNHQLPLDSISTCKATSIQVSNVTCSGMTSTQIITFSFTAFTNVSYISQNLIIQIDGLFSPPTTSPPDVLVIGSYSSGGYQIDQCSSTISGLIPKNLSLGIVPTANPMYINSFSGLNFSFTTLDTITKTDYFTISFPLNSSIVYTFKVSNFLLGTVTYSSVNCTLTFLQLTSSSTKYSNTLSYIMFLNYKSPLTTKTTTPITLTVWNSNGHKKMQGYNTLTAVQNQYQIINVAASNYTVNSITTYYLTFNISDTILSSAMISIQLPPELKSNQTGSLTVCPTTNASGSSNISCNFGANQGIIILKNIFSSAPSSPIIIKVSLFNLVNINYQTQISAFIVNLYYDTDPQNLVATYTQNLTSNSIQILASELNSNLISVSPSNYSLLTQNVSYTINFTIQNGVPANGFIIIELPSNTLIYNNVASCSIILNSSTYNVSCSWINSTDILNQSAVKVKIQINSLSLKAGNQISVKISSCCVNPSKTRPIQLNQISTHTSTSNLIQYFYSSLSSAGYTTQFVQVAISQMSLYRQSTKNDDLTTIYISFTQPQQIDQNSSYLVANFNILSTVYSHNFFNNNSSPLCSIISISSNVTTFQTATCILTSQSSIKIIFPSIFVQANNLLQLVPFQCNISITLFKNPPSFAPIKTSMSIAANDNYLYSSGYFSVQNTVPSSFSQILYQFSSRIYETTTNLTINMADVNLGITQSIYISQLAQYLTDGTSAFDCLINNTSILWQLISGNNQLKINFSNSSLVFSNPLTLTLQLINLYIPLSNLTSLNIQTYQQTFMISQDTSIVFSTVCKMPCKECPGILQPNFCTACFQNLNISANKYLFNNTCLKICPIGTFSYIASVYYQYLCQFCNQTCYTCKGLASNCTSCNYSLSSDYPYFYLNSCLSKCPDTTFANITSSLNTCQKCVYPCGNCLNQSQCITCQSNLLFYKNQCVSFCPINITILNINSTECLDCAKKCKTCENQTTTCTTCFSNGSHLYVPSLMTCVSVCPATTVLDTTYTKCVTCQYPCQSCAVVQTNCTSCLNNTFLSNITQGACLDSCEIFYFANISNHQCQLCASVINCRNCSSPTQCLSCDGGMGYVYFPNNMSCLFNVPPGYVNISGIAEPCQANCTECIQTAIKCTKCSGLYFLNSNTNECVTQCPVKYVGINNICVGCTSPCQQCALTKTNCTKCLSIYYLWLAPNSTSNQNKCYMQCPQTYYNSINSYNSTVCKSCIAPCLTCNSNISCQSCISGLFLYLSQCVNNCPNETITKYNLSRCDACLAPCFTCVNETYFCLTCINFYYYQKQLLRCYLPQNCPAPITVANHISQTCDVCQSPCLTCQNLTSFCLSCISNYYLNSLNNCVTSCSSGFYGSLGLCVRCLSPCLTCTSQSSCLTCLSTFYVYQSNQNSSIECLPSCPANFNIIVNGNCTACQQYCLNCSSTNVCYQCSANAILYKENCIQSCPSNLIYYYNTSNNKKECVTQNELAQQNLTQSLSLISILPLPFLIFGSIFFITGLMSKLQHQDTWIIGWGYVVFGVVETGSLAYLLFMYMTNYQHTNSEGQLLLYMLFGVIGSIIFLNFLSLTCMTPFLSQDSKFSHWISLSSKQKKQNMSEESLSIQTAQNETLESDLICCENSTSFIVFTILAFLISYKIKIIFFTKLFQFSCMSAKLQSTQKFSMFNIFSFLGVLQQGVTIYILYKILTSYQTSSVLFLPTLDCLIITIICIILTLISTNKEEDFFKPKVKEVSSHDKLIDNFKNKDKLIKKNFKLANQTNFQALASNHILKQEEQEENSDFDQIQQRIQAKNNNQSRKPFYTKGSNNKVQNIFVQQQRQNQNFSTLKKSKNIKQSLIASKMKKHPSPSKQPKKQSKLKSTFKNQNMQQEVNNIYHLQNQNEQIKNYNIQTPRNNNIQSPIKKQWVKIDPYQSNLKKKQKSNDLKQFNKNKLPRSGKQWVEVASSKKLKQHYQISPKQRVDLFNPYLNPTIETKKNYEEQSIQNKIEQQESQILASITSKTKKRSINSRQSFNKEVQDSLSINQFNKKPLQQHDHDFDQISLTKNNRQLVESNPQSSLEKGVFYEEDTNNNKSFQPLLPFVHEEGQLKYTQRITKTNKLQLQNKNIFQLDQQQYAQQNNQQEYAQQSNSQLISKHNDSLLEQQSIKQKDEHKKLQQKQDQQFSGKSNIIQKQNYQTINKTLKQLSQQLENNNQKSNQNIKQHLTNNIHQAPKQLIQQQYEEDQNIPLKIKLVHHPSQIFKKGQIDVSETNQYSKVRIANKIQQKQHQLQLMRKSAQKLNQVKEQKKISKTKLKKNQDVKEQIMNLRKSKEKINKQQQKVKIASQNLSQQKLKGKILMNQDKNTQIFANGNINKEETNGDNQNKNQINTYNQNVRQSNRTNQNIEQENYDEQNNKQRNKNEQNKQEKDDEQNNKRNYDEQNNKQGNDDKQNKLRNDDKQEKDDEQYKQEKGETNEIRQTKEQNKEQQNNIQQKQQYFKIESNQKKNQKSNQINKFSYNKKDYSQIKFDQDLKNNKYQNKPQLVTLEGRYNSISTVQNSQKNDNQLRIKPLNQDVYSQSIKQYPTKQRKSQIVFQKPLIYQGTKITIDKQQQIPLNIKKNNQIYKLTISEQQNQSPDKTIGQNNKNYETLLKLINKNSSRIKFSKKNIPKDQKDQKLKLRISIEQSNNAKHKFHSANRNLQMIKQKLQNGQYNKKQSELQNNLNEDQNIGRKLSAQKRTVFKNADSDFQKNKQLQQSNQDILGSKRRMIGSNKSISVGQINFGLNKRQLLESKDEQNQQSKISLHVNKQKLEQYLQKDNQKISQQMLRHHKEFDSEAELKQWKNKFLMQPQQFVNMKQEYHKNNIPIKPIVYSENVKTNLISQSANEYFQDENFENNDNKIYYNYQKKEKQSSDDQIDPYDPQFYYQMLNSKNRKLANQTKQKSRQKSNERRQSQEKQKRKRELQKIYRGYYETKQK